MTKEEMIAGLKKRVIDSNLQGYIDMFNEAKVDSKSDDYWINATNFYGELDEKRKEIFFSIVKQIQIDMLAEILAYLDGVYWVEGQDENLELTCLDNPKEKLNEDLTDIFLNTVYEWDR
jgi:hypothetical protein